MTVKFKDDRIILASCMTFLSEKVFNSVCKCHDNYIVGVNFFESLVTVVDIKNFTVVQ